MVPHNYLSVYFKPMSVDKFCWPHIKVRRSADSPLWADSPPLIIFPFIRHFDELPF